MKRICVFCGSNRGNKPEYVTSAEALAEALVRRGIGLVYGGGSVGLMGALADAVLAGGGMVTGVIPEALSAREIMHAGLTELRIVDSMHTRKATMADLADGFLALPGGYGTFEEFFEVLTWAQLGFHPKPCALLNVAGFFDPLLALLDHAIAEGFVAPRHRALVLDDSDPDRLLDRMAAYVPVPVRKWIDREES